MILVDTSVWISHIRQADAELSRLLMADLIYLHPFVVGELVCGNLPDRNRTIADFALVDQASVAKPDEVLAMIEGHQLYGQGLGWADVNLLASALVHKCALWTLDNALRNAAKKAGVKVHGPAVH